MSDFKKRISTHDFVIVGKDIYLFSLNYNGLYCLHMPKRQLEFLGSVPNEEFRKRHLYGPIIEADGKLYMPPMNGKEIAVYDIEQKKFDKIALRSGYKNSGAKFFGALYDDGKVFFIPCWYRYVVVLDLKRGQVVYLDEWKHKYRLSEQNIERFVRNGFFIKDKVLYMASMIDNSLISISTEDYETKIVKIGSDSDGFADMCFDEKEKCIWFLKKSKPVIERWELGLFETRSYEVRLDCYKQTGEYPFINVLCDQERVYLISFQSNISVVMDKKKGRFFSTDWAADDNKTVDTEWGAKNYFAKIFAKNVFVIGTIGELSFFIICKGKKIGEIYLEDPLLLYRFNYHKRGTIREDDLFGLEDFLTMISIQYKTDDEDHIKTSCGSKVYKAMDEGGK